LVCLVAFTLWELHTRDPVVHFSLFRYRTFSTGTCLSLVLFFALYGSIVLLPLFMQELLNFPAFTAGVWNAPRGMATLVLMPIAGYLIGKRWDMRALLSGGLAVSAIGAYLFSYLNLNAGPWNFFWPLVIMGAGLSFMFVPLATITVDPIPQEEMGYATSLIALARNLGAGIGISAFTAFEAHREQFHQMRLAASAARDRGMSAPVLAQLEGYLSQRGAAAAGASHGAMALLYRQLLQHASALSYLDGFRVMAVLLAVTIPFVWIMKKPVFKSTGKEQTGGSDVPSAQGRPVTEPE
jgi:MFS transporter, DHA2 family, multidrug resistance protein